MSLVRPFKTPVMLSTGPAGRPARRAVRLETGDGAGEVALTEHHVLVDAVDHQRRGSERAPGDVRVVGVVAGQVLFAHLRAEDAGEPVDPHVPADHLLCPRRVARPGGRDGLGQVDPVRGALFLGIGGEVPGIAARERRVHGLLERDELLVHGLDRALRRAGLAQFPLPGRRAELGGRALEARRGRLAHAGPLQLAGLDGAQQLVAAGAQVVREYALVEALDDAVVPLGDAAQVVVVDAGLVLEVGVVIAVPVGASRGGRHVGTPEAFQLHWSVHVLGVGTPLTP